MNNALDLHLTEPQRGLYCHTRGVAREGLRQIARRGQRGRVNRELIAALAEHGLLARLFGGERGAGATGGPAAGGTSAIDLCLIREALARECTEAETAFALQGLGAYPILQNGSEDLREYWIPRVADGRAVAAFALTEPDAGSDAAALSLRAEPEPGSDGWLLHGEKLWISNAPEADIYTVFARTGEERGPRGVSAFAVAGDSHGLSGEPLALLASHAIGSLHFDGVLVEHGQLLGELGGGFAVAMRTLNLFRPSVGAFGIGMARAALDLATDHALARETFGKPLAEHQAVSHRLADISTRVEAARLLVHHAAAAHDAGIPDPRLAAMAKLLATETAQEAVDAAVQFHGARALEQGHELEHLYREVRAPRIYEGASEIQREIIARGLFRAARARRAETSV
jgi:acyl-CoA dehydrogenase